MVSNLFKLFFVVVSLAMFAACATTQVQVVPETSKSLTRPGLIFVYDFAVTPD
jgi:uncharacterized lipoprotein YajG